MASVISIDSSSDLSDLITELHVTPDTSGSLPSSQEEEEDDDFVEENNYRNSSEILEENGTISANYNDDEFYDNHSNNVDSYSQSDNEETDAPSFYMDDESARYHFNIHDYLHNEKLAQMKRSGNKKNLTFTKTRLRDIERSNHILLQRLMTKKPMIDTNVKVVHSRTDMASSNEEFYLTQRSSSGMINRKKIDKKIASENEILKKKLERISKRRVPLWK